MAWMGKAIWESSLLNSMKQYETKDKWHIIYVYKCNPFMSTERKWGEFKNFLRIHDRKPYDTPKTFQNLRLLPGLSIFWQVHMPCLALATVEKKTISNGSFIQTTDEVFQWLSFFATKNAKQQGFPTWGKSIAEHHWRNATGRKADRNETTSEFPPLQASKRNFKIPKMVSPGQCLQPAVSWAKDSTESGASTLKRYQ